MDKVKYIYPLFLAIAVIKGLVLGFQWVDAPVIAILAAIAVIIEVKDYKKQYKLLHTRMDAVDLVLTNLTKENNELKTHLSGMKIAQRFQQGGINNVSR